MFLMQLLPEKAQRSFKSRKHLILKNTEGMMFFQWNYGWKNAKKLYQIKDEPAMEKGTSVRLMLV